jgi:hypothetical protein
MCSDYATALPCHGYKMLVTNAEGCVSWLKRAVLKTAVRETVPGVRIPLPPPFFNITERLTGSSAAGLISTYLDSRLFQQHGYVNL